LISDLDDIRRQHGFLSMADTAALIGRGVVMFDPYSTLISEDVDLGAGVVIWPGVTLQRLDAGTLAVGTGTVLHSGTRIVARGGTVVIGRRAEIGEEGGFTLKADRPDVVIEIGDEARLLGGGSAVLNNVIGRGAQVLGPIRMQECRLEDGGSHVEPDPDRRGGVLKGAGVARGLSVPRGGVIQAFGTFEAGALRRQVEFHPKR
jgi:carbonic anhydrase/acetyltransferase-like protein (isoleucine patch superfamily)